MIWIDIDMPEKCGLCPLFHAEHPMHCQGIKADRKKKIVAPYRDPRPEWCPINEVTADTDTVSRKQVIDALFINRDPVFHNSADFEGTLYDISNLPPSPTPSRSQWTPCSKKLPEENVDYWVTVDPRHVPPGYRSTDVITWRDGKWVMADYFVLDGEGLKKPEYKVMECPLPIIAWMPPPEAYREEGETDDND